MSTKTDKAEIVQRINAAVKSAGLPELPFDLLHKADAVTLNLFYDRWLTVALGRIMGGPPTIRGRTREEFGPLERQVLPPESKKQPTGMTEPSGPSGPSFTGIARSLMSPGLLKSMTPEQRQRVFESDVGDTGGGEDDGEF
jgi:hypothetical protein